MSVAGFLRYALFPDCRCWLCHRDALLGEDHLCDACRSRLEACPAPAPLPPLDGLSAGLRYAGAVQNAVHAFKYGAQLHYAAFFAQYIPLPEGWRADCLVPVPLHPLRAWRRGFNQSEELCRELAKSASLPVRPALLRRVRRTPTQTGLDADARSRNVAGAFLARPEVRGLNIVLVDDVCTTQATLTACAKALKNAGAAHVYAACACFAGD
ncbi:MAG: ComF family protein [Clostridia bacterium]|nr:ComF family protein [Clostridia bacterium]